LNSNSNLQTLAASDLTPSSSYVAPAPAPAANGAGALVPAVPGTPKAKRRLEKQITGAKTPKRARRTASAGATDGRKVKFIPKPSQKVSERIERAESHRLQLLEMEAQDDQAIEATVIGHAGCCYDIRLGPLVTCSCPDFAKSNAVCKHTIFIFLRVLEVPKDDPRVWQRGLLPPEILDLRQRLRRRRSSPAWAELLAPGEILAALRPPARRQPLGSPCPLCLDIIVAKVGVACCASCGVNIHDECLAQWQEGLGSGEVRASGAAAAATTQEAAVATTSGAGAATTTTTTIATTETKSDANSPLPSSTTTAATIAAAAVAAAAAAATPYLTRCPNASCSKPWLAEEVAAARATEPGRRLPRKNADVSAVSALHAQPISLEESYPTTYSWIARRESGAAFGTSTMEAAPMAPMTS